MNAPAERTATGRETAYARHLGHVAATYDDDEVRLERSKW